MIHGLYGKLFGIVSKYLFFEEWELTIKRL
jgi:hypothetical protein